MVMHSWLKGPKGYKKYLAEQAVEESISCRFGSIDVLLVALDRYSEQ